jgi:hypothetical protein
MTARSSHYVLETARATYLLDGDGYVLGRSNGPKGWRYGVGWRILGLAKRHHSRCVLSLEACAAGADFGHGIVHDLDHGTHRSWGMERARRVYVPDHERTVQLVAAFGICDDDGVSRVLTPVRDS